jgi:hypothetical protein
MLFTMISAGVLLNISQYARAPADDAAAHPAPPVQSRRRPAGVRTL